MTLPQIVYPVVSPSAAGPDSSVINGNLGDSSGGQENSVPGPAQAQMAFHFSGMFEDTSYPTNFDSFSWVFEPDLGDVFWSQMPSPMPGPATAIGAGAAQTATTQQPVSLTSESQARTTVSTPEIEILPRLTTRDRCGPDDAWPMEWHAVSDLSLTLPPLGPHHDDCSSVPGSFYTIANTTEEARAKMLSGLQLPLERIPWQTVSLANFPSTAKIDHCIDMFFRHYDRVCLDQPRELTPERYVSVC